MPIAADLYYSFHAQGGLFLPPLLLLAGAGGDHLCWPAEIRRFPGFRVYGLDLPGHGRSAGSGRQSIEDYEKHVIAFMDSIGIWRTFILGHSMGGAIALSLARDHPDRVAGLGIISSGARLPVSRQILENAATPSTFPFAVERLHTLMCGDHTPARLIEQNLVRLKAIRPTLLYGDLLACQKYDLTDQLVSIGSPSLIICGADDKLTPPRNSTSLAAHLPGAALQIVDDAGHLVMLEQPKRLVGILSVFFHAIPYQPGS